ncbi:hypothetical protein [Nocardia transvalensis]|uniref:hypothetical protein n=1 Tax=Nocardia transvalensis TaxID=37333 RepID=UPI001892D627|nr:hypothetical protein [Nocardia transvalensis]MBF6333431.1 hypothetical protein [Nocardia transvalensis]
MVVVTNENSQILYLVQENDRVVAIPAENTTFDAKRAALAAKGYPMHGQWLSTGTPGLFYTLITTI